VSLLTGEEPGRTCVTHRREALTRRAAPPVQRRVHLTYRAGLQLCGDVRTQRPPLECVASAHVVAPW